MSSRTQTSEVLLRWKYVRQAVRRALYILEQFTISEADISYRRPQLHQLRLVRNTSGGNNVNNFSEIAPTREITTKIEKIFLFSSVAMSIFLKWA